MADQQPIDLVARSTVLVSQFEIENIQPHPLPDHISILVRAGLRGLRFTTVPIDDARCLNYLDSYLETRVGVSAGSPLLATKILGKLRDFSSDQHNIVKRREALTVFSSMCILAESWQREIALAVNVLPAGGCCDDKKPDPSGT